MCHHFIMLVIRHFFISWIFTIFIITSLSYSGYSILLSFYLTIIRLFSHNHEAGMPKIRNHFTIKVQTELSILTQKWHPKENSTKNINFILENLNNKMWLLNEINRILFSHVSSWWQKNVCKSKKIFLEKISEPVMRTHPNTLLTLPLPFSHNTVYMSLLWFWID